MAIKGIDVSEFQGSIDWNKVKADGVEFAILKFGNIYDYDANYKDSKFDTNYKKCQELGIKTGIYIYNYCNTVETLKKGLEWTFAKLGNIKLALAMLLSFTSLATVVLYLEAIPDSVSPDLTVYVLVTSAPKS